MVWSYRSDNFGGSEQDLITALFCTEVDWCAFHALTLTLLVGTRRVSVLYNSFIENELEQASMQQLYKACVFPSECQEKEFLDTALELVSRTASPKTFEKLTVANGSLKSFCKLTSLRNVNTVFLFSF